MILLISYPPPVLANNFWQGVLSFLGYQPRRVRKTAAGRGTGGGGRGNCPNLAFNDKDTQLVALIPGIQRLNSEASSKVFWSYSIKQKPNLWFYIPYGYNEQTQVMQAKLALIDEEKQLVKGTPIFYQLPDKPGIAKVKLPINLEVKKPYKWFFSIVCDENKPSRNPSVSGWIQKVHSNEVGFSSKPSQDLLSRLNYRVLANKELWFHAFARLSSLQREQPKNFQIQNDWNQFFEVLELGDKKVASEISQAPIVELDCEFMADGGKCD